MSLPSEGLVASISIGGTVVGKLAGITLSGNRELVEWAESGQTVVTDVLKGVMKVGGGFSAAFIAGTHWDIFVSGTALIGTIFPRGGTGPYIAGTIVLSDYSITGMEHESANPVIEEGSFVMYNISSG